jgi:hypothetical protein
MNSAKPPPPPHRPGTSRPPPPPPLRTSKPPAVPSAGPATAHASATAQEPAQGHAAYNAHPAVQEPAYAPAPSAAPPIVAQPGPETRLRVSVKLSVRDPNLLLARPSREGEAAPPGTRAAVLVLSDPAAEPEPRNGGAST